MGIMEKTMKTTIIMLQYEILHHTVVSMSILRVYCV